MKLCGECHQQPIKEPGRIYCSRQCAGRAVSRTNGAANAHKGRIVGAARFWAKVEASVSGHGWTEAIRAAYLRGYHAGKMARVRQREVA